MGEWAGFLNAAVGLLQLTLAALVARHLVRFGRAFPWLGALMAYFDETREDLIDRIDAAARELEQISLDPSLGAPEERSLRSPTCPWTSRRSASHDESGRVRPGHLAFDPDAARAARVESGSSSTSAGASG
jgi:hypothetical protein